MRKYFRLLKIHHWIKNLLVFFPLVFGGQLFNFELLSLCVFAFFAFSLMSSTIYIINDIMDVENDRMHSVKRKRPIASGAISIKRACAIIAILLVLIVFVCFFAFAANYLMWLFLLLYFVLNILYSMGLKNYPIMDIMILTSGFIIRLIFGSLASGIAVSNWLYLTVLSMALYLVLGKRRNEKKQQKENTRKVLKRYTYDFLDKFMFLFLGLTITFYSLWAIGFSSPSLADTAASETNPWLMWTVPLVIIICMKYSLKMENTEGDPVDVVLSDKILMLLILLYILLLAGIIYLK